MTIVKFQPESITKMNAGKSQSSPHPISDDSVITKLESSILGLCLRRRLSTFDKTMLDTLNNESGQLFIVLENRFIYPENTNSDNYAYGLVLTGRDLNVCDLKNKHRYLAGKIEQAWPTITNAARRISEIFEKTGAAMVINRSSGRIVAITKDFTATTGLDEDQIIGHEYSLFSKIILNAFSGNKINIENIRLDEIFVSIMSFTSPKRILDSKSEFEATEPSGALTHHRIVDENETIELHFNRLNSVLKANLQSSIAGESISRMEEILSSLTIDPNQSNADFDRFPHSPNFTAVLRLLLQAVLISHRIASGSSLSTKLNLNRTENGIQQITFETNVAKNHKLKSDFSEWLQLAQNIASQIGLKLSEPQMSENRIVNIIQFKKESTIANANKS